MKALGGLQSPHMLGTHTLPRVCARTHSRPEGKQPAYGRNKQWEGFSFSLSLSLAHAPEAGISCHL